MSVENALHDQEAMNDHRIQQAVERIEALHGVDSNFISRPSILAVKQGAAWFEQRAGIDELNTEDPNKSHPERNITNSLFTKSGELNPIVLNNLNQYLESAELKLMVEAGSNASSIELRGADSRARMRLEPGHATISPDPALWVADDMVARQEAILNCRQLAKLALGVFEMAEDAVRIETDTDQHATIDDLRNQKDALRDQVGLDAQELQADLNKEARIVREHRIQEVIDNKTPKPQPGSGRKDQLVDGLDDQASNLIKDVAEKTTENIVRAVLRP